jgi:BirA family biotin operon repressor/biotin-[acetyl-CoA-carboxylase] ligase
VPPPRIAQLPLLAAAATHQAVERQGVEDVALKWPNDLVLDGAKLGGVLVHARHGDPTWATVGVGVNVARTPQVEDASLHPPTSLAEHLGAKLDDDTVVALAGCIVASLTTALEDPDPALERWRSRLVHRPGDRLTVRLASGEELTGSFGGLSEEGFLVLETGAGRRVVSSGDVIEGA